MSKPLKEVIHGSATLLKLAEKPLGIGLGIGLSVGAINTYFLDSIVVDTFQWGDFGLECMPNRCTRHEVRITCS